MSQLTIKQALAKSALLTSDSAALDVQLLLLEVLNKPSSFLFTWPDKALTEQQLTEFSSLLARRVNGEPVAYILGYQHFWTLKLAVNTATLIPRADTELLVEQALECLADGPYRVADLGTGTGAVALALASERKLWCVDAVEYREAAAALAQGNAQRLGLDNVQVLQGSWFEPLHGKYQLIVSNPPYIDPQDKHLVEGDLRFEPASALVADNEGLSDLVAIIEGAPNLLSDGAWLLLEHGYDQGQQVRELFKQRGFIEVQTIKDLNANDRVTMAKWH